MGQLTKRDWKAALSCADSFLRLAEPLAIRISEDVEEGRQPQAPEPSFGDMVAAAVNLAFAIEVYIKVILFVSNIDVPKHHDLGKLFAVMPRHFKVLIEKYYEETRRNWSGKRASITIAAATKPTEIPKWDDYSSESSGLGALFGRTGDLFSSWRYIYEFKDSGACEYQFRRFEYGLLLCACHAIRATVELSQTPSADNDR